MPYLGQRKGKAGLIKWVEGSLGSTAERLHGERRPINESSRSLSDVVHGSGASDQGNSFRPPAGVEGKEKENYFY